MTDGHGFPNHEAAARELGSRSDLSLAEFRSLLCADCDFYDEEHEDDLECSCFRMLREIIVRGVLTPGGLARVLAGDSMEESPS